MEIFGVKFANKGTDIHVSVPAVKVEKLTRDNQAESSQTIQERVQIARDIQQKRFKGLPIANNEDHGF